MPPHPWLRGRPRLPPREACRIRPCARGSRPTAGHGSRSVPWCRWNRCGRPALPAQASRRNGRPLPAGCERRRRPVREPCCFQYRRQPSAFRAKLTIPAVAAKETRIEKDSMGEMEVPADAYYGASTQRAVLNFPIPGQPFPRRFLRALGLVKKAAAQTNGELGLLSQRRVRAIVKAAQEVVDGKLDDQFPIDVYQTGSGTSTNTNANEVIANRATEILGGARGSKLVHPNDHVNLCQSSNDVIPTAIQVSWAVAIADELIPALQQLQTALEAKSKELWPVVKTGRTHLMDATPIRMGQEFKGYAGQVEDSIRRARAAVAELTSVPLGGTAVGTELNVMMPVAAVVGLESITLLAATVRNFRERCIEGLQASERGPELVERSPMLATALNPVIGYDEAAKIAKESIRTGKSIRELARARGVSEAVLNKVLDLGKMTKPGLEGPGAGG